MSSLSGSSRPQKTKRKHVYLGLAAAVIIILLLAIIAASIGVYYYYNKNNEQEIEVPDSGIDYPDEGLSVINITTSIVTTSIATTSVVTTTIPTTVPTTIVTTTIKPTCSDGIKNQGESDVDCGGPCLPCVNTPDGIASCLALKGVKLYTRGSICMPCNSIRTFFGGAYSVLDVENCEDSDDREECLNELEDDYDVDEDEITFPTWIIYGVAHPSIPVSRVQELAGCA